MEKAKAMVELSKQESESVSKVAVNPHIPNLEMSFYEDFSLRGISVDRFQPGLIVCSFKVPPRLTCVICGAVPNIALCSLKKGSTKDKEDKMTPGAIANLVDEMGGVLIYREGLPMNVSITMSISYVSTAKVDDELEITSRLLGQKGSIFGTSVLFKNKATGDTIAEGRHTLFSKHASKI